MTTYYIASAGSNTAPYNTWAKAATTPLTVTALMGAGDIAYIRNEAFAITVDTVYTFAGTAAAPCWLISTADTAEPPTTVASGAHITGSATAGVDVTINGKAHIVGVDFTSGGSTTAGSVNLSLALDDCALYFENCVFTIGNSNGGSAFSINNGSYNGYIRTQNCSFVFWHTAQRINQNIEWNSSNDTFAATGIVPTGLLSGGRGTVNLVGANLSAITGTLLPATTSQPTTVNFVQCKIGTGVTIADASTGPGHFEAFLYDCAAGDTHYQFAHYNYWGNTTISSAIYLNGSNGASYNAADAKHSWKISGVNGTFATPYVSPWIDVYNEGVSAVTPRLEIVRVGSATAYNNDEVWAGFAAKITASSTMTTINDSDRKVILATAAAQASSSLGAGDWTGEGGTAWFGKLEPSATITPAEIGHIRARVSVAGANTVYVNPKILGI